VSAGRIEGSTAAVDGERRWRLEDQRDFLVRSLADLRAERAAGDIGEEDFAALLARDEGRLSAVRAELAELDRAEAEAPAPPTPDPRPRPRRRRRWLAAVAAAALAAGATLLAIELASPRVPGEPATGSTPGTVAAELDEAAALVNQGTTAALSEALALYRSVLKAEPDQPQALAETGYLEWEAGFSAADAAQEDQGKALVARSLAVEPDDFAAHLFLGTIDLEQGHDARAAVSQYRAFLAEHPPKARVQEAAGLITQAFRSAGDPVPAAVSAPG
jgi:tetratricopeptide (TPR) repeat protein